MNNIFNSKLYNKYYPIVTEKDKNKFLNSNHVDIYRAVRNIYFEAKSQMFTMQHEYISKMKQPYNYRNILHNKKLTHQMLTDERITNIENKLLNLEYLACNLMYYQYNDITIDELNRILKYMNFNKYKDCIMFLLLLILIIICICLFIFKRY